MTELGPALAHKNGFSVHEVFVRDATGGYVSVGFGIINPEGRVVAAFASLEEAIEELGHRAGEPRPRSPRPSP